MNITNPTNFGIPGLTLSTSNAEGTGNAIRTGATILTFDGTLPDAISFGQSGGVGSATVASRRDHSHAMASETPTVAASQAEMEAASSTTVFVTPGRTQYHPGVAKAWCKVSTTGSLGSPNYGIDSVSKGVTGKYTITFDDSFSSAVYSSTIGIESGAAIFGTKSTAAADTAAVDIWTSAGALVDAAFYFTAFGDT